MFHCSVLFCFHSHSFTDFLRSGGYHHVAVGQSACYGHAVGGEAANGYDALHGLAAYGEPYKLVVALVNLHYVRRQYARRRRTAAMQCHVGHHAG